jgi:glycosyltransferase involved in cell wall biosynthesis
MLNRELQKQGISSELILDKKTVAINRNGDSVATELPTVAVDSIHLKLGIGQMRFRRISAKEFTADLVIVEQAVKNISSWIVILVRKILNKPTALWGHGVDYVNTKHPLPSFLRMKMIRKASHILVYTSGAKEELILRGVSSTKITNVQNSTDTRETKSKLSLVTLQDQENFIASSHLSKNLILFLGSLDANKNLELLFAAAEIAHEIDPSLTLAVVGDGPLRSYVETMAANRSWIQFLGRSEEVKVMALASAKALVIPGRVGLVATDALASGIPVVTVSHALHAPEFDYLLKNQNCLLSSDSPRELGEKIIEAISSDFQTLAHQTALRELPKYSTEQMVANFVIGVKKAIGPKNG